MCGSSKAQVVSSVSDHRTYGNFQKEVTISKSYHFAHSLSISECHGQNANVCVLLIFVFGSWGFGVGEIVFCIGVLGGGFLSFVFCPEIIMYSCVKLLAKQKLQSVEEARCFCGPPI